MPSLSRLCQHLLLFASSLLRLASIGGLPGPWVAERFFGSVKRERTSKRYYLTRQEARDDVIDSIEMFSNSWRKHSYLG